MRTLAIVRPLPIYGIATYLGNASNDQGGPVANLLTPDPREAFFQTGGGDTIIDVNLGRADGDYSYVDTFFVGYVGNAPNAFLSLQGGGSTSTDNTYTGSGSPIPSANLAPSSISDPPYRHFFVQLPAPVLTQKIRFKINSNTAGTMSVGVIAAGLSFAPQFGQEYGAGRTIEDTGTVERLFGGSFGIDAGARIGGYAWTFGDLQRPEVEALYRLQRYVGTTGSVLVVEDPDPTNPGLTEAIHWGLFRKLEAYERLDALNTKWSLQIGDWA